MSRKAVAVTRREYVERVRTRWFLISTFALPVVLIALMLLPEWLISRPGEADAGLKVGILDAEDLAVDLERALGYSWDFERADFGSVRDEAALRGYSLH